MPQISKKSSALPASAIRKLAPVSEAAEAAGVKVYHLNVGAPDIKSPECALEAVKAACDRLDHISYSNSAGLMPLRKGLVEKYYKKCGIELDVSEILIDVAGSEAFALAMQVAADPGEEIIVVEPFYTNYNTFAFMNGITLKAIPTDIRKGFQVPPVEEFEKAITPKTKAIVLTSPNNPTGVVLNGESIAAVKRAVLGKPIFVICDNVYNLLCDGDAPDLSTDPECAGQTLVCQSFSKPWAMTGWRVGYLTAPAYVMDRLLLLSAATIASVPTFVQAAAVEALRTDPGPLAEIFRRRREYVTGRLKSMGLPFPEPRGAFYVFPDIRQFGMTSDEFCTRMIREAGVAAVPGSCFGLEGYVRLSCCCGDNDLREGLDRMEHFLAALPHCAQ